MIRSIHIENFKSVVDLTLDIGRFNILIGENGCGKSNILEAVAFGGAAETYSLENEFLNSRGIRNTNPSLMFSAFKPSGEKYSERRIILDFVTDAIEFSLKLKNDKYDEWEDENREHKWLTYLQSKVNPELENKEEARIKSELRKFLIYSPENSYLRQFKEEGQILPLGIKGEGLFSEIKRLFAKPRSKIIKDIKENLSIIDWFEDFVIPSDNFANEYRIQIKDRYLEGDIQYFDQRSANEGFLFLLFYLTLFTSDKTPAFFAIDNIEASFNPKMCIKLVEVLNELSIKYSKQVIITTHNPAILDGLNLNDNEQKLFVIRRNIDGHTIATHISEKPKTVNQIKLSEMWTRGLLGGLPNNF